MSNLVKNQRRAFLPVIDELDPFDEIDEFEEPFDADLFLADLQVEPFYIPDEELPADAGREADILDTIAEPEGIPLEEHRLLLAKMDAEKVIIWLTHVKAGTTLVYHEGNLGIGGSDRANNRTADIVAKLVVMAYKHKLVHLTQKRFVEDERIYYTYQATRTAALVTPKIRRRLDRFVRGVKK